MSTDRWNPRRQEEMTPVHRAAYAALEEDMTACANGETPEAKQDGWPAVSRRLNEWTGTILHTANRMRLERKLELRMKAEQIRGCRTGHRTAAGERTAK